MTYSFRAFAAWFLLVLVVGCAGPGNPNDSPQSDAGLADAATVNCGSIQLTYANFGKAFLTKYCNACHSFTQQDMQTDPTLFIDVAVTSTYMPISSILPTSVERMDLGNWLTCGAP
jgi:hypothetical protein